MDNALNRRGRFKKLEASIAIQYGRTTRSFCKIQSLPSGLKKQQKAVSIPGV
jgi:hypothetical protein